MSTGTRNIDDVLENLNRFQKARLKEIFSRLGRAKTRLGKERLMTLIPMCLTACEDIGIKYNGNVVGFDYKLGKIAGTKKSMSLLMIKISTWMANRPLICRN